MAGWCLMFRPIVSATSRRAPWIGCSRFVCGSSCGSGHAAGNHGFSRELDGPGRGVGARAGVALHLDVANDPFFGKVGQMMAVSQRQNALKFELLIPYYPGAKPTACMSFNCHLEHFGEVWGIHDHAGAVAHTGCVAFGMDRLAVALFANHGVDVASWPDSVRQALAF